MYGSASSIHWGSWNIAPVDNRGLLRATSRWLYVLQKLFHSNSLCPLWSSIYFLSESSHPFCSVTQFQIFLQATRHWRVWDSRMYLFFSFLNIYLSAVVWLLFYYHDFSKNTQVVLPAAPPYHIIMYSPNKEERKKVHGSHSLWKLSICPFIHPLSPHVQISGENMLRSIWKK